MPRPRRTNRQTQYSLPSGRDTLEQPLPHPVGHREDMLPLPAVGSVKFEKLCRDVLRHRFLDVRRSALKRESGLQQFGVDVEGFDDAQNTPVVVSCKCWGEIRGRHLLPWTEEFTTHLAGHWKDRGVKRFVLAITHPGNADEIAEAARRCRDHLAMHGIEFELWDILVITDLLRKEVELVDRYFNRVWVEAISPLPLATSDRMAPSSMSDAPRSSAIQELAAEIGRLSSQRNEAIGQEIDTANAEFRAGRPSTLRRCLDALEAKATVWATLDPTTKAKALRARAMLALNQDDLRSAGDLLDQADNHAPAPDRSARAWHLRASKGIDEALSLLAVPITARESETKAALYLDQEKPEAAIATLDAIEGAATSEQMRLRALAQCLTGARSEAVETAAAARAKPPRSFAATQTHAILHVMAALSDSAEPQLGSMPNPFSASLVKGTRQAVEHLDRALNILDDQIPTVEGSIVTDLEVWKLATLLIHPARSKEARAFANRMLAQPTPEPLAVAWCHSAGLKIRSGKIRKCFEDVLRKGQGTPSQVIVLALLESERRGATQAARIIARHRPQFPDADFFLAGWQAKLEGVAVEEEFARAIQQAETRKDYEPLVKYIGTNSCTGNEVLLAAGLLAARRAWKDVNTIRPQLLKVSTPRAIDLAARAAVESGLPVEATAIIDQSVDCFFDGQLSASLEYLRARALDDQGRKGAAIAALATAAQRSGDTGITQQLIHSLIGIGDLREARRHADRYVTLPSIGSAELVHLAHVFRSVDAAFSRTLVARAAVDPTLPTDAAPSVMALATQLGLLEIEGQMMRVIATATKDGSAHGIIRFDHVEDVIAFMEKRGAALEQEYSAWLAGAKISHLSFDARTFACLYLADPPDRMNALHQPMPMLVRAGNAQPRQISTVPDGDRPHIILDASALLLASRCKLLPEIEKAFTIQLPPSLAIALLEIEDNWPEALAAALRFGRAFLAATNTAVRTVEQLPANATRLDTDEELFKLDAGCVAAICEAAVVAGNMQRSIAARLSNEALREKVPAPISLALAPWSLLLLAQAEALEPIARTLPTYLSAADRRELAESLDRAERTSMTRNNLTTLRELVAKRLATGSWTTLPSATTLKSRTVNRLPSHVLALAEILEAFRGSPSTLMWIEDRALSRARPPLSTSIIEVLDHLREKGFIDEVRYWTVDGQLRDVGYAYMPVPVTPIADDVLLAPVADDGLVETPELTKWRCWFAQEVARLRHADQAPEPDAEGRIAGEPRHVLAMMSTARDVLARIWAASGMSVEDKQARSKWVWTCLRFESTSALPWSTANVEARVALVASVLFHAADLPLVAMLGVEGSPNESYESYIEWFISSVLDPRCAIDPTLGDSFGRQLASLLASQLGDRLDDGDESEHAKVRAYLVGRYRRFLNLFPKQWRDKVLSFHNLAAKLGIGSMLTVEVGGVEIAADVVSAAINDSLSGLTSGSPVTTPLALEGGEHGHLRLMRSDNNVLDVEITVRGAEAHLDPIVVALSISDGPARAAAVAALPAVLDLPPNALASSMESIAEPTSLGDRVSRLKAAQSNDFRRHLGQLHARLVQEGKFEITDLALPEPEAVAQYLRLQNPFRAEPGSWLDEITASLLAELGPKAAARRCAAIPFELPANFLAALAAAVLIDVNRSEAKWQTEITSPAHGLLVLKSIAAQSAPAVTSSALLTVFLDRIDSHAGLMTALLRKGARQLGRTPSWNKLNSHIALALLWVWADRLTSTFASQPIDMAAMIHIVERSEPAELTFIIDRTQREPRFYDYASEVDLETIQGAFGGAALRLLSPDTLPEDLKTRLLGTFGHSGSGAWHPKFQIAAPPRPAPVGMWIAADPVSAVQATGARPVLGAFGERDADRYVHALVAEPLDAGQPFLIVGLLSFLDFSKVSPETAEIVVGYVDGIQAQHAMRSDEHGYRRCYGVKAAALGRMDARATFEQELNQIVRLFQPQHASKRIGYDLFKQRDGAGAALTLLLEMAIAYTRNCSMGSTDKVTTLASFAQAIVSRWPASVQGVIAFLDRSIEMLPAALGVHVWPALLAIRARA